MKRFQRIVLCGLLGGGLGLGLLLASETKGTPVSSIYDLTVKTIEGKDAALSAYTGQVVMIVNVASKCGFTPQYKGLEALYQRYRAQGFVVLGFPSNDFLGQEPGTDAEIQQFCSLRYQVTFPLFSKITVKGKSAHPLYQYLTDPQTNPEFGGNISWNFNKFLIDRRGRIVARFGSRTTPESEDVKVAIEKALADR
jgi:glutathione peroxidase